jgi:cell division transport system permease protein
MKPGVILPNAEAQPAPQASPGAPAAPPPAPLLPTRGEGDRALVFVVAVLACLACLAGLATLAAGRMASGWSRDIAAAATVQVRPSGAETPYESAVRAAEVLAGVKGVAEARALDRAASEALLKPWLGDAPLPPDLPVPQLVTVELDPKAPASPADLKAALTQARIDAVVDDHGRWLGEIRKSLLAVQAGAFAAFLLVAAAAAAVTAYATRASLAARQDVVEVLHLSGAEDRFIAGLFQRRFALLAARAGGYGALAAAAPLLLLSVAGKSGGLLPATPLGFSDALLLLPCPLLAAGVAAWSARHTAARLLGEQP